MKNKTKLIILAILILIGILSYAAIRHLSNSTPCYDCGERGWQIMKDRKCESKINNQNDFELCLFKNNLASRTALMSSNITQGYIKIGEYETYNTPKSGGIDVWVYQNNAIDKDGNIYLLYYLG